MTASFTTSFDFIWIRKLKLASKFADISYQINENRHFEGNFNKTLPIKLIFDANIQYVKNVIFCKRLE